MVDGASSPWMLWGHSAHSSRTKTPTSAGAGSGWPPALGELLSGNCLQVKSITLDSFVILPFLGLAGQ